MINPTPETRKFIQFSALLIWRTRALWIRALLCWAVGAVLLMNDELANFDVRLQLRGSKTTLAPIVLVDVSEKDWSALASPEIRNVLRPLKEVISFNDAYFWNPSAWEKMLSQILGAQPRGVGVAFFFGENIGAPRVSSAARVIFDDPRVVWAADIDSTGRALIPYFASTYNNNVGLRSLRSDDDGTVRRFAGSQAQMPHLATKLAELAGGGLRVEPGPNESQLVNFLGDRRSFQVIGARELMDGRAPASFFKGKIVLIGNLTGSLERTQTPLGRMSRTEVIANVLENMMNDRSIVRFPPAPYLLILFFFLCGSIWVLVSYPQSVTLVIFFVASIVWASFSVWAFDIAHVWVPVLSPLVQLTLTCIVFLSYQLALNERRTWRLQQEQKYLSEIEQLKTNFVSMMSHDLKTPIAKIQAIADRLLVERSNAEPTNSDDSFTLDLKSLRRSSDELHRYIQSILQVTKVEAKDFKILKSPIDINEQLERVLGRLRPLASEKAIVITEKLEPMFSIEADPTLIQEVIHNLIENAVKYTPNGGTVHVSSQEKDDNVLVTVEDTGPGIDPTDQKDIWGKFTRGRKQSLETKGTGLGLYLVKYFIELHGGKVFLESKPGVGTKIGFSIPVAD